MKGNRSEGNDAPPQTQNDTEAHTWLDDDYSGQLAVDVYQDQNTIVIASTVAGVTKEDLDISITNDMVTIRGRRKAPHDVPENNYFYQECYWGGFSRSIILPFDVKAEDAKAALKNGVLTITLPKADSVQVKVVTIEKE